MGPELSPRLRNVREPLPRGEHDLSWSAFHALVRPPEFYASFEEMRSRLEADPVEAALISDLEGELARHGRFRSRLRIEDGELANGCHRYCALARRAATTFEVLVDEWGPSAPYTAWARFSVEAPETMSDETVENALLAGRSLAVGDEWVECDVMSGGAREVTYAWYADEVLAGRAVPLVIARLGRLGLRATLLDISVEANDDDVDEGSVEAR